MNGQDLDDFQQWLNDNVNELDYIDAVEYLKIIEEAGTDLKQLLEEYPKVIQD